MTLTKEDLQAISDLLDVKLEEKLEIKLEEKLDAKLERKLDEKLGKEMTLMRAEMADFQTGMREEMSNFQQGMREEMANFQTGMREEMVEMQTGLRVEMAEMRTDLQMQLDELNGHVRRIEVDLLENHVIPRLKHIEECYISASERYMKATDQIEETMFDVRVLKNIVAEHDKRLKTIEMAR